MHFKNLKKYYFINKLNLEHLKKLDKDVSIIYRNYSSNINKNLIISQWNEDPIMPSLKDSKSNVSKISFYGNKVDHNFITTDPSSGAFFKEREPLKDPMAVLNALVITTSSFFIFFCF